MTNIQAQQQLESFLMQQNWLVEKLGNEAIYRLTIPAGREQYVAYALIEGSNFMFYPMGPHTIPAEFLPEVAEYITRVNNQLWNCNFELDGTTAQIRCKASYNFKDLSLDTQIVENCVYVTVEAMSYYWPGILAIITQKKTALQAYQEVEPANETEATNSSTQLLQKTFVEFFEQDQRHYQAHPSGLISVTYGGHKKKSYFCYTNFLPQLNSAFFMVGLRGITDENNISSVIKWIIEVNYSLRIGYFNFDFSQNHLSFIVGLNFYQVTPNLTLARNMVYPAVTTADSHWPVIQNF